MATKKDQVGLDSKTDTKTKAKKIVKDETTKSPTSSNKVEKKDVDSVKQPVKKAIKTPVSDKKTTLKKSDDKQEPIVEKKIATKSVSKALLDNKVSKPSATKSLGVKKTSVDKKVLDSASANKTTVKSIDIKSDKKQVDKASDNTKKEVKPIKTESQNKVIHKTNKDIVLPKVEQKSVSSIKKPEDIKNTIQKEAKEKIVEKVQEKIVAVATKKEDKKALVLDSKIVKASASNARNRLKNRYNKEIRLLLQKELGYKNEYQVPRLNKIILNMRLGDIKDNNKSVQSAIAELTTLAGQKAVPTKAKKSVANFKVRENQIIGGKVTLRGDMMYEFFDKLVSIVLPRVRDFRGVSDKSFDGRGNYAMGIKEHIIFPEISYELVEKIRGLDISIVTTAKNDKDAKIFLAKMGMPFVNKK